MLSLVQKICAVTKSNGTELEKVVHTHRTTRRSGLPSGFADLNPTHLLLLQWIPILANT